MQIQVRYITFMLKDYLDTADSILEHVSISGFDIKKLQAEFIGLRQSILGHEFIPKRIRQALKFVQFPEYKNLMAYNKANNRFVLSSQLSSEHFSEKKSIKKELQDHVEEVEEILHMIEAIPIIQKK